MKKISFEILITVFLIVVAVFSRLIPHAWNFTALGAVALFAGHLLRRQYLGLVVAVLSLLISDSILGFHNLMAWVYIPLFMSLGMGYLIRSDDALKASESDKLTKGYFGKAVLFKNAVLVLSSSFVFFLVSNFGVWFEGSFYSKNITGLMECYAVALPFLKNQIAGDFVYTTAIFASYQWALNFLQSRHQTKQSI
jgi:hypothetical protein